MKKIDYKYRIIISAIICFIVFACNEADEFLEIEDPNLPVPTFNDLSDTNEALNGAYSVLRRNQYFAPLDFSMLSDESLNPENRIDFQNNRGLNFDNEVDLMRYDITSSNEIVENVWTTVYEGILQANFVIDGLQQIESSMTSEEERAEFNSQMGQARFLRGMGHFLLHSMYRRDVNSSIILRDSFQPSVSQSSVELSTSEAVMESYVADFEFARLNAPLQSELNEDELGRVTRGAATMLLGNHYLYERDFQKAADMYNSVINDFSYQLAPPSQMFTDQGAHNSGSILEITYGFTPASSILGAFDDQSTTHRVEDNSTAVPGADGAGRFRTAPALWLINEYQNDKPDMLMADNLNVSVAIDGVTTVTNRVLSQRTSAMIAIASDEVTPFYLSPNFIERTNASNNDRNFYNGGGDTRRICMYKKYASHDIQTSKGDNPRGGSRFSGRNIIVLRLAEAYINLAECLIALDDVQGAINQLNEVRKRWNVVLLGNNTTGEVGRTFDGVNYDASSLMEHIMFKEKPLELSCEGFATRLIDLRRWEERGLIPSVVDRFTQLSSELYFTTAYKSRISSVAEPRDNAVVVKFVAPFSEILRNTNTELLTDDTIGDINTIISPASTNELEATLRGLGVFRTEEFVGVPQNYASTDNGYFPIPDSEVINNNSL